jgi:hypothetical protein
MLRKLLVLVLLALASFASARTRAVSPGGVMDEAERRASGSTVSGLVTGVNGSLISIAGGLVTIDATGAKVTGTIEPGAMIFATVRTENGALLATNIVATRIADATISGNVDSVDVPNHTLTILGRTIHVTAETSFGGIHHRDSSFGLDDILAGQLAAVQAENVNGRLVATSVLVLAPVTPSVHTTRGTVKSIGNHEWTIDRADNAGPLTLVIDAQTKIIGTPKVGDTVEVLYRVDSANANVAIAIMKFSRPELPTLPEFARVSGTVKSIDPHFWVVGDVKLLINDRTKIEPGIHVGDAVEALGEKHSDGSVTAIFITKKRF